MSDASLPPYDASTYIGYFDPKQPIADLLGNLPHWRQEGVTYFGTVRLADSIPQATLCLWLRERDDWLKRHPEPRDERPAASITGSLSSDFRSGWMPATAHVFSVNRRFARL